MRAADRVAAPDPEVEPTFVGEVRESARLLVHDPISERSEELFVEPLRPVPLPHVHSDVLDHLAPFPRYSRRA